MKSLLPALLVSIFAFIIPGHSFSQQIKVVQVPHQQKVAVTVDGKPFTFFCFPDSLEKPFLYPLYAPDGGVITRGFPLEPRPGEPIDHPHHIGLWLNYENVNGLDFWNNSYAIAADKKAHYGWIKTTRIVSMKSGKEGQLTYEANWTDINNDIILKETTTYVFSVAGNANIIDRITTLTAINDVTMPDVKDGFLGLRVAHELELPSKEERDFTDANGIITKVKGNSLSGTTGNYITSAGKTGDSAWGTRADWCMLYGKKGNDSISIVIIDHPKNTGYPAYWHARGYGLFAANPLGQKIFSNGKEALNFSLKKEESVQFRYRIVINAAKLRLPVDDVNKLARQFSGLY